ncbi:hypothetical protein DTO217A2_8765 [Paecilomyces variotii]|nr:hypothetical protein DTO217A2_8765 [Paecilomyces variotii]KAJ9374272.1 hypothetical protein DTO282E5_1194 [Paecilomyces variotii]KAJ9397421.1 hypothetical protein DTO282F9_5600 [Paecilomyces variotii]
MVATASDTLCWFAHRGWHGRSLEALTILLLFDSRLSRVLCFSVSTGDSTVSQALGLDTGHLDVGGVARARTGSTTLPCQDADNAPAGSGAIPGIPSDPWFPRGSVHPRYAVSVGKKKMKLALLSQSTSARHGPLSPSVADSRTSSSIRKPPPFALHVHSEGVDEILFACFCLSSGPSST